MKPYSPAALRPGLRQRDAADRIGMDKTTILNWERGRPEPEFRHLPAISDFLGYVPETGGADFLGAALIRHRRSRRLSQAAFAASWASIRDARPLGAR